MVRSLSRSDRGTLPPHTAKGKRLAPAALFTVAVAVLLAACAPTPRPPFPPVPPTATPPPPIAGERYEVMPGAGHLTIKVYRDGPLKALGHNHVITTDQLHGFVVIADDPLESQGEMWLDAADLVVDDASARAAAGPEFASIATASDVDGTRRNMESERVLDAAAHPRIQARIRATAIHAEQLDLTMEVEVAGRTATLPLAARYARSAAALVVTAQFKVEHADLGLEPYSVLGGALRVASGIDVEIDLRMAMAP